MFRFYKIRLICKISHHVGTINSQTDMDLDLRLKFHRDMACKINCQILLSFVISSQSGLNLSKWSKFVVNFENWTKI